MAKRPDKRLEVHGSKWIAARVGRKLTGTTAWQPLYLWHVWLDGSITVPDTAGGRDQAWEDLWAYYDEEGGKDPKLAQLMDDVGGCLVSANMYGVRRVKGPRGGRWAAKLLVCLDLIAGDPFYATNKIEAERFAMANVAELVPQEVRELLQAHKGVPVGVAFEHLGSIDL